MIESILHFLQMGGYAPYVWLAYGMALMVLILNVVVPRHLHKKLLKKIECQGSLHER